MSFFPQLIAGPIVHHKDMLPQFSSIKRYQVNSTNFKIGLTIFAIGLFKTKLQTQAGYSFRLTSEDKGNLSSLARFKEKLTMVFSLDAFSASINTIFQQSSMAVA